MEGYECWQNYLLIKTHFSNSTFDATKYRKPSGKVSTYEKRNDKRFFEFLAKRFPDKDIQPFFISQFLKTDAYIIDMVDDLDECIRTFHDWKRRMNGLQHTFEKDCRLITNFMSEKDLSFDDIFRAKKERYPIILRLMMEKFITLETYIILEKVLTLSTKYNIIYTNDHIYEHYELLIRKYGYYFKFVDVKHYKKLMRDIFTG